MCSPIEMLKIRMQVQTARMGSPEYRGSLAMVRHMVATEGALG